VRVADGQRQRVGGVVRPRDLFQPEQPAGHLHHLLLFGQPVADHRLLDLHRRILVYRHAALLRREQDHPARLRHVDAGGLVVGKEELLDRHRRGRGLVEHLAEVAVDDFQARRKRHPRRRGDRAEADGREFPIGIIDHPEADRGVAGVDSQNYHDALLYMPNQFIISHSRTGEQVLFSWF